jgi:hypothetical protein
MRSLVTKLILAFLLVGLTGSVLVAVIVQQRTRLAFNEFILNREQQTRTMAVGMVWLPTCLPCWFTHRPLSVASVILDVIGTV